MKEPVLLVEKANGIATITLNRPQAMNALSRELSVTLCKAVDTLEADDSVKVLILTGAGKAFCAGLDLKEAGQDSSVLGMVDHSPMRTFDRLSKPLIGAINGFAITGGFELALACDLLIASTNARFADTHARVGIVPGWGLSQKLSRVIGIYRAKELSLTGNFLSADQAEAWGLVNRVVAPEELLPTCQKLAEDMLSVTPGFLPIYKKLIDDGYAKSFGKAIKMEDRQSRAANAKVTQGEIEARRENVRARGQKQRG